MLELTMKYYSNSKDALGHIVGKYYTVVRYGGRTSDMPYKWEVGDILHLRPTNFCKGVLTDNLKLSCKVHPKIQSHPFPKVYPNFICIGSFSVLEVFKIQEID